MDCPEITDFSVIPTLHLPLTVDAHKRRITGCITDVEGFGTLRTDIPFTLLPRLGFERRSKVRIQLTIGNAVVEFPAFVEQIFERDRTGSYLVIPGSCGGAIDIPVAFGSASDELMKTGVDVLAGLELERNFIDGSVVLTPKNTIKISGVEGMHS
ncbi:hypothetical protein HZC07_04525 [Candidatus Micrarchaeota archaeon]|nr:hypothetical protein [Candidatus Micrarchaeota archaeon]